ncbi:hypothetical protein [Paenibacillus radicis (ex Xue et al. 2023)]|uniref:SbsC C-terminal domain-containing protein n=1 Tax=Paenibacillus radicis (ex Xue et al. 2023) TaxID=2972489 RepID=A0ABT1YG28_9BACL|nr:hypothetical protein [Paenibacillus radicis (ex Xue et al. 2023)]MCR8631670.1 hypothetical protein [Paenibacillus radicis (ex Xue et al. 2023)]
MRKWGLFTVLFALLTAASAYAHLTGAFADFLVTIQDTETTSKLTEEMRNTRQEIEALKPKLEAMELEYGKRQQNAVKKLKFYSEFGLDTWMTLMLQSEQLVDMMGSQWLLERNLDRYMQELDALYQEYTQLRLTKGALEGHGRLLAMIEDNLSARTKFLSQNPNVEIDQLANFLDIDWSSEVEVKLIAGLKQDQETIDKELTQWAVASPDGSSYKLDEAWLNGKSGLEYFFRSDHLYVLFKKTDLHVILIGRITQGNGEYAGLEFEAGFFNGFLMPDTLMKELQGFRIPYGKLPGRSGSLNVQQTAGALLIKSND